MKILKNLLGKLSTRSYAYRHDEKNHSETIDHIDKKECPVCSHLEEIKIEHPSEMLSCVETVKELIASGNFEKLKSNFELENPKTEDGYWQDDVMYYSLRCKNCGQEFSLCCETYHGSGGSFSRIR